MNVTKWQNRIMLILVILLLVLVMITCIVNMYYHFSTTDKHKEVGASQSSQLVELEVVKLNEYLYTTTNQFGAVPKEEIKYNIICKDENGKYYTFKEYGENIYHNIKIVESGSKFVYNPNNWYDNRTTLYISEDLLKDTSK